ncbi:unnamed protein product [Adineta steineri]|uniref:Uncharacterized protein n=1 Tax=Adineta steineri TaxID=433720 RepID=A0A819JWE3_9BILA|nr:unnamed protein product [Adineta steineri]
MQNKTIKFILSLTSLLSSSTTNSRGHPKPRPCLDRKPLTPRASIKNNPYRIENSYLLLIPIELLFQIISEDNEEYAKMKQKEIKKIGYSCISYDNDNNAITSNNHSEWSSMPTRKSCANSVINSTEKV